MQVAKEKEKLQGVNQALTATAEKLASDLSGKPRMENTLNLSSYTRMVGDA